MSLVPPGRAARPEAVSSLAPRLTSLGAPCVLASERPSRPGDEASLCWSLLEALQSLATLSFGEPAKDEAEQGVAK
jgi:hypothetical protein